jgi:hypothetical protein
MRRKVVAGTVVGVTVPAAIAGGLGVRRRRRRKRKGLRHSITGHVKRIAGGSVTGAKRAASTARKTGSTATRTAKQSTSNATKKSRPAKPSNRASGATKGSADPASTPRRRRS